jgi:hypothetical protein
MEADVSEPRQSLIAQLRENLRVGISELRWRDVILFGVGAGVLMPLSMMQSSALTFVAGIIPVGAGLLIGRRVKGHYGLHGFVTGLIGALVGLVLFGILIFFTPIGITLLSNPATGALNATPGGQTGAPVITPNTDPAILNTLLLQLWLTTGSFIALSLIAFCTFGASTAGRAEQRNRQGREEVAARGGRLERPSAIRTADDIRGLSLPQFGTYVSNLFKKKGFQLKNYQFIDKDKHLDLWMEYEGEPWHLRLSVADKVNPGTIEGLSQEIKREGCRKGVVVTSTEFTPGALKSAKGRPIVLIDGQMLYEIAEK